jgi:DNA-binding response OmpR family regulator
MTGQLRERIQSDSTIADQSNPAVLVVDDENDLADLYSTWLTETYAVETAYSGSGALDTINRRIDVVLLDRHLSDFSGDEVLAQIRNQEFDCLVAMVTAVEPDFDIVQLEFDEYLTKPVSEEEIRGVVHSLLARKRYDEKVNELFSLVSKRTVLMDEKSTAELKHSDEYRELVQQIQTVNTELDGIVHGLSARDTEVLFAQLDSRVRGSADD